MSLAVDVRDLLRQPASSRRVSLDEPIEGLATELVRVPEDRAVRADLLLESVVEGILAGGRVRVRQDLSCARCLGPAARDLDVEVQELFAPGAGPQDDEYSLVEGSIDLEPMIRDAVLLATPFAPLCRPDCLGLCERCGGDRNVGECGCGPVVDARWSALEGLDLDLAGFEGADAPG